MNYITAGREPFAPYRYFEEISAIPRCSYDEEEIAEYLCAFAKNLNLWYHKDEYNNVYIKKPGSPGCEGLDPVILQAHIDMVCEKNLGTTHDFKNDPLDLYIENGRFRARGTTLGADDGMGVAFMLGILAEKDAVHPPLECIFTALEEVGLIGAIKLDYDLIAGRRMISLDSGPEGGMLVGAAGGCKMIITLPIKHQPLEKDGVIMAVRIREAIGGHSGSDIGKERANANKLMGRILSRLSRSGVKYEICDVSGGISYNAIPRECDAVLCVSADCVESLGEIIDCMQREISDEYKDSDPNIRVFLERADALQSLDAASTHSFVNMLDLLPSGRMTMSVVHSYLVTLSLNQAVVTTEDADVKIVYSLRGAKKSALKDLTCSLADMAKLLGGQIEIHDGYPAWEQRQNSKLCEVMLDVYHQLRGKDAFVQLVHGGVECGIFVDRLPDLDVVATGPDADMVHTPDEWLDLESFGRTYEYLLAVLKALAGQK